MKQKYLFKIEYGFDHFNNYNIFRIVGVNNDHVGEWHKNLNQCNNELNNL